MKALRFHEFGGPDKLKLEEFDLLRPGAGQVEVSIRACALNHIDVDIMRGLSRFPIDVPFVPGIEVVGVISEIGPEVTGWSVGDRVAPRVQRNCGVCEYCQTAQQSMCESLAWVGMATSGGCAEALVCEADQLVAVPDSLSDEAAAAVQVAFGTAWHMLFTRGRLRPGETVLVNAVGSGIGSAAVQLASWAGARVIGTASSQLKLDRAAKFGMEAGINYADDPNFSEEVLRLTGGRGVDLVFEHVGGNAFTQGLASLKKSGRLVTCGAHSDEVVPLDIIPLFRGQKEIIGSFSFVATEVEKVFELAASGVIKPIVDSVFSLEEGAAAVARMESRDAFGKILITPS